MSKINLICLSCDDVRGVLVFTFLIIGEVLAMLMMRIIHMGVMCR